MGLNSLEEDFWIWFEKNEQLFFDQPEDIESREQLYFHLQRRLQEINHAMGFAFGPPSNEEPIVRELVISANGLEMAFDFVLELIDMAPDLPNWKFTAFRPRVNQDDLAINFGGLEIGYSDLFFNWEKDEEEDRINLELHIRNFDNSEKQEAAVFILMDTLLGEYDSVKRIGSIEWKNLEESEIENLNNFVLLRSIVDEEKSKMNG